MTRKKSPGVTLIVVLGVLTLMVLLATVFASMTSTERTITRNYLDTVRAKLAAQTGIDRSVESLMQVMDKGWFDKGEMDKTWVYFGSQSDETKAPVTSTALENAVNPSFAYEAEAAQNPYDANTNPRTLTVRGKTIGLSGFLPSSTYGDNSDIYSMKILDCQSMINVNDGYKGGRNYSVSKNLERLLNNLGDIPTISIPTLGTKILDNRPPGGYKNKYELIRAVGYDQAQFDKIKDFLTVVSWVDTMVCNPVPLSPAVISKYKGITYDRPQDSTGALVYRYGHNINSLGAPINMPLQWYESALSTDPFHNAIWEFDTLSPQYIEMVERAPVNINTASREVLIALISELQGFFPMGQRRNTPTVLDYNWMIERYSYDAAAPASEVNMAGSDVLAWLYATTPFDKPAGGTGVAGANPPEKIADEIIACRTGGISPSLGLNYKTVGFGGYFRSWAQFNRFLDYLVSQQVILDPRTFYDYHSGTPVASIVQKRLASQAIADTLKANFNPNLHLNELNPNKILYTLVDKTDLVCNSTEGCFTPMGCFEIESLGYVLKPVGGRDALTVANNELVASQKITTIVKLYDAVRETSQSQFYQGDFSPRQQNPTTNNDRAVECGPEPDNGPQPGEADYEGYVALSTLFSDYHGKGTLVPGGVAGTGCPGVTYQPWWFWTYKHYVWDDALTVYVQIDWWDGTFYRWDVPKNQIPGGAWQAPYIGQPYATEIIGMVAQGLQHWQAGERTPPASQGGSWGGSGFAGINAAWGGMPKPKSALWTTSTNPANFPGATSIPVGESLFGDVIHSHFRLDHCAHYHKSGSTQDCLPVGAWTPNAGTANYADRTEALKGPYNPVDSVRVNKPGRYRLGKAYRVTPTFVVPGSGTILQTPPPTVERAPSSDLRYDGAYCEFNSAFGYVTHPSFDISKGAIGFWMKPNFTPECTGRTRLLTGLTRYTSLPYLDASGKRTQLFSTYWYPYHRFFPDPSWYGAFEDPLPPIGGGTGGQQVIPRPTSMGSIWSYSSPGLYGGGSAAFSPTLNHKWHGTTEGPTNFVGTEGKLNHMRSNEWMFVLVAWHMVHGTNKTWKQDKNKWVVVETGQDTIEMGLLANGIFLPGSVQLMVGTPDAVANSDKSWKHTATNQPNTLRIGGEYTLPISSVADMAHKYFADATIDEFYYWDDDKLGIDMGSKLASYGRYYKPIDTDPDSGVFTSRNFPLNAYTGRPYPAPCSVAAPAPTISTGGGSQGGSGVGGGGPLTTTTQVTIPVPAQKKAQVVAIQWTALAEDYVDVASGFIGTGVGTQMQTRLKPVMYDYNKMLTQAQPPVAMSPQSLPDVNNFIYETVADAYVIVDGVTYGPYRNEPWSPIRLAHAGGVISTGTGATRLPPTVTADLRYKMKFRVGLQTLTQSLNAMLLTTPFVDDVTLFYTKGEVEYLSWTVNP